jgi:hypothetical protein
MITSRPKKNIDPNFSRPIIKNWPRPDVKDPGFNRPSFPPGGYGSLLPRYEKECVDPGFSRTIFGPGQCESNKPVVDPGFSRTLFGTQDSFVPSPEAMELLRGR